MKTMRLLLPLILFISCVLATPELVIQNDHRSIIDVAEFGFLPGGRLTLIVTNYKWDKQIEGISGFYIRKGRPADSDRYEEYAVVKPVEYDRTCFLNNTFIQDEVNDGTSLIELLPNDEKQATNWKTSIDVKEGDEGYWQVLFISCKTDAVVSFKLLVEEVNPNGNYLSAGDIPLPYVYGISSFAYALASAFWLQLLILKKNTTRVFRAHWFMFVLLLFIVVHKALQSAKYHYMGLGLWSEGWKIGFYVFAGVKGILSLLIIVLLASGWMFIKPFLNSRDKKIISVVIPLQVFANIASAIGNETAIGSSDWPFWNMLLLPLIDITSCGIIIWTILQTRKHLASTTSVDGKQQDIMSKYKLWSSFYVVTLVYIYVTRIVVQLLQAALTFQYVNWFGEAVNEIATCLFYLFIGYKFRPYPNNPYTEVSTNEDDEDALVMNHIGMVNRRAVVEEENTTV